MVEEPVTYYASKDEAIKEATRRVDAGACPDALAIVSTEFGSDAFRWGVTKVRTVTGATLQARFVNIKGLEAEKQTTLWTIAGLAFALTAFAIIMFATLLVSWRFPDWFVVSIGLGVLIGLTKLLFYLLAPNNIFTPVEGFDCPDKKCSKYVATDDPWICGHCDAVNMPGRKEKNGVASSCTHWLIQRCSKCSYQPSSYLCHHCGGMIYLDESCDGQHPARAANKTYPAVKPLVIQEIQQASSPDGWKAQTESQIGRMAAEKTAFSTVTQKVCELRDAELKRIDDDQTLDLSTKNQLKEFERQWANRKLQDLKMRAVRSR